MLSFKHVLGDGFGVGLVHARVGCQLKILYPGKITIIKLLNIFV
jgi:hypothetical protein